MTYEEAIHRITVHNSIHQRREPRSVYITEALHMAVVALEKQIPKKIVTKGHFEFCPNCIITTLKRIVVNAVKNFCGRVIQND